MKLINGFKFRHEVYMNQNSKVSEPNDVIEVDFDTVFPDEDPNFDPEQPVKIPAPTPIRPKQEDDGLLDLSDESTLDRLAAGGFLRIRPEGQNVISVALFKPAVLAATHYFQEKNKVFRCLQPSSDYCCKQLGEARDVIGVLAVQYCGASPKDATLKKGTDPDLRVGYMSLSKSALNSMRKGLPEGSSLYGVDWKCWKRNNGIGYEFAVQRLTPAYKTLSLDEQVQELIAPYKDGTKLRKRVAKPMTMVEVKLLFTGEAPELRDDKQLEDMETM
jgi:hypothetical protein